MGSLGSFDCMLLDVVAIEKKWGVFSSAKRGCCGPRAASRPAGSALLPLLLDRQPPAAGAPLLDLMMPGPPFCPAHPMHPYAPTALPVSEPARLPTHPSLSHLRGLAQRPGAFSVPACPPTRPPTTPSHPGRTHLCSLGQLWVLFSEVHVAGAVHLTGDGGLQAHLWQVVGRVGRCMVDGWLGWWGSREKARGPPASVALWLTLASACLTGLGERCHS